MIENVIVVLGDQLSPQISSLKHAERSSARSLAGANMSGGFIG